MPSPFALLLRVLLSITLILNSSGAAVAATQMQLTHAAHAKAEQATSAKLALRGPAPACHEHAGMAAMPHEASSIAMSGHGQGTKSKHPSPNCCNSGNCSCACTQQAPAALAWFGMPDSAIAHDSVVRGMTTGRPSPALPHLTRPPIG